MCTFKVKAWKNFFITFSSTSTHTKRSCSCNDRLITAAGGVVEVNNQRKIIFIHLIYTLFHLSFLRLDFLQQHEFILDHFFEKYYPCKIARVFVFQ